jgi:dipeptidyl aminopeptidase/acylaminoacyl peptidase
MRTVFRVLLLVSFLVPVTGSAAVITSRAAFEVPAAKDAAFTLEKIAYTSDGIEVFAYLYLPAKPAGKVPCVIFNRGSFIREDFAADYIDVFQALGRAGFAVIAPMYRQSGGAAGRDEVGGADLADLMRTLDVARELELIDTSKLFMYGHSRGGAMTYMAIRDDFPVRAAAVVGAFTDFGALVDGEPRLQPLVKGIWPDYAERRAEISGRRSAIQWPEKLDVPLLILHGGKDRTVDPAQAIALASKLEHLEKEYELLIRAGGNHSISKWGERDAVVIDWFRRHME